MAQADIQALLDRVTAAGDPDALLAEVTIDRLSRDDPEFGKLARLAAIPRRLDAGVVAVLGDHPPDEERDRALLERLAALDFVDRTSERIVYHDRARSILLSGLREDDEAFRRVAGRLWRHYALEAEARYEGYAEVRIVAPLLRAANPDRFRRISEAAERALVESAGEAIYHVVVAEPDAALGEFRRLFSWFAVRGLWSVCRALRAAFEEDLREHSPATLARRRPWLDYYDGRLNVASDEPDAAEAALRHALDGADEDTELRMAAIGELAQLLEPTYQVGEALELTRQHLALAQAVGDLEQERSALAGVWHAEVTLGRLSAALDAVHELEATVERDGDTAIATRVLAMKSLLAADLAPQAAAPLAVAALDNALGAGELNPQATLAAEYAIAGALRRFRVRFALTAYAAGTALTRSPDSDPDETGIDVAGALLQVNAVAQAAALLAAVEGRSRAARVALLIARASLSNALGDLAGAAEQWSQVLESHPPPDSETLAFLNRADIRRRQGETAAATLDCDRAEAAARRLGHEPFRGMVDVVRSRIAQAGDQLDEAASRLQLARPRVAGVPRYLVELITEEAHVAQRRGDLAAAVQGFADAAEQFEALGAWDRLVQTLAHATVVAADAGEWEFAAKISAVAAERSQALAEVANFALDPADAARDDRAAAALRVLHALAPLDGPADDDDLAPADRAAQLLEACAEEEPDNPLYWAFLGYAEWRRGNWSAAAGALRRARTLLPAILDMPAMRLREGAASERVAVEAAAAGDYDAALLAFDSAEELAEDDAEWLGRLRLRRADLLATVVVTSQAIAAYEDAGSRLVAAGRPDLAALALARNGVLRASVGELGAAEKLWIEALGMFPETAVESPYWQLLSACSAAGAPARTSAVRELLLALRNHPAAGGPMRSFTPQISAGLPDTWSVKESITLLAPDGTANVIASSEPVGPDMETDEYARIQGDLLQKEFPGYELHEERAQEVFGSEPGVLRRFTWRPPDGSPVTQIQLYAARDGRGFTATATAESDRFAELELQLLQILEALMLTKA